MIMGRIAPIVEGQLTDDQRGFYPGHSCCGKVANLTQYVNIELNTETCNIIRSVFVDLSAAYDTMNHHAFLLKLAIILRNGEMAQVISVLENQHFFVKIDSQESWWCTQWNGLPQDSRLSSLLFNGYTNDQPEFPNMQRLIYSDDICIATQSERFENTEHVLSGSLNILGKYYCTWFLKANPGKAQVCAFQLKHHQAKWKSDIVGWHNPWALWTSGLPWDHSRVNTNIQRTH